MVAIGIAARKACADCAKYMRNPIPANEICQCAQGPASSDYAKYMRNIKSHTEMGKHRIFRFAVPIVPTKSASISHTTKYDKNAIF